MTSTPDDVGGVEPNESVELEDLDDDAAARGAVYGLLARLFEHPDEALHGALADGSFAETVARHCARTALDVDPPSVTTDLDRDALSAQFNDLFVIGYSEYEDRTDGSLSNTGPPISLYESTYRSDVSWSDVNLDLARAYEYFGVEIGGEDRQHHDHAPLLLEFAGYLARREAAIDEGAAAARLDVHDRHLGHLVDGMADRRDDLGDCGVYGDAISLLESFAVADREDLASRLEGGDG